MPAAAAAPPEPQREGAPRYRRERIRMSDPLDTLLTWLNERRDAPEWTTLGIVAEKVRAMKAELAAQGERLIVGDSDFEGWYSDFSHGTKAVKQKMREAYEAGMNDCAEQPAQAEVVAWRYRFRTGNKWYYTEHGPHESQKPGLRWERLYTAPPAPAPAPSVPAWMDRKDAPKHWTDDAQAGYVWGWNACRAAMLAAAPEATR